MFVSNTWLKHGEPPLPDKLKLLNYADSYNFKRQWLIKNINGSLLSSKRGCAYLDPMDDKNGTYNKLWHFRDFTISKLHIEYREKYVE